MTHHASIISLSGREAAMARRKAMSQGKAGLPAPKERVRSGFREASLSSVEQTLVKPVDAPAAESVRVAAPISTSTMQAAAPLSGREASMARRRLMSSGKAALMKSQIAATDQTAATDKPADLPSLPDDASCREVARQRRSMMSRFGRGDAPPSGPSRPPRQGEIAYPQKVATAATQNAASVTGMSFATGRAVTGSESGQAMPLTGTQYIGPGEGGFRSGVPGKVGHARTSGGQTVSGTMVRSKTRITGDEANEAIAITGKVDQTLSEDLSEHTESVAPVSAQFQRQTQPHGQSVFGNNLGRTASAVGSRSRTVEMSTEATDGGNPVSGTAIGRSNRVSGDFRGTCQSLTGSQYLAPAQAAAQCGGSAPEAHGDRNDPVTLGKVKESRTWQGQKVTGPEFEHNPNVSGGEAGSCASLTGTPYFGATGAYGWCDAEQAGTEDALRNRRLPQSVTGNVPVHDPERVSGTGRGAERDIGGTPYFMQDIPEPESAEGVGPVRKAITGFSVNSPQRASQLASLETGAEVCERGITGTFAQGEGKITGNVEFAHRNRGLDTHAKSARVSLTGEGSTDGTRITGSAWSENSRVTGTDGQFAANRNSTERTGSNHGFAGTSKFRNTRSREDQKSAVTGAVGWTPKSGAAVTLSGGAAG